MIALARLLLFLLPFAIFILLVVYLRQRREEGRTISAKSFNRVLQALIAAITLFVIVAVVSVLTYEDTRDKVFVPPQNVDGEVRPGHFEDPPDEPENGPENDPEQQ